MPYHPLGSTRVVSELAFRCAPLSSLYGDMQVVLGECYEPMLLIKRQGLCRAIGMSPLLMQALRRAINTCQLATPPDPDAVALLYSALAPAHNDTWPSGRENHAVVILDPPAGHAS